MTEKPEALWENYLAAATSDDDGLYAIEGMTEAAHDIYLALIAALARVAAREAALATVAQAFGNNPSDALADLSEADYLRYYLGNLRSLARDALAEP